MQFLASRVSLPQIGAALIAAVWLFLAVRFPETDAGLEKHLVLTALAFLAAVLPIAVLRDYRISFLPVVVFTAALIVGPWAAGALGIGVCALEAALRRRKEFWRSFQRAGVYALATLPLAALRLLFPEAAADRTLDRAAALLFGFAAVLFFSVAVLPGLAALRRRLPASRGDFRAAFLGEAVAFAAGLPFAALLLALDGRNTSVVVLAEALAMAAAVCAIRASLELRALRQQVRVMESLGGQGIGTQNLGGLLAHLLAAARDLMPFDQAIVWTADAEGRCLERQTAWPESAAPLYPPRVLFGEKLVGRVAERRRGLIIAGGSDPRLDLRPDAPLGAPHPAMASVLVLPLMAAERAVGVALFAHREAGRYVPRDLERLRSIANLVASAIENVRLHQSIRAMAVTDGLTGLTNHRRLQEILTEEIWRSQRYGSPVAVIMCDLDSFKAYNDTYGHPQGDELLRRVARILQNSVRTVDTVARYGGEEFCIVLPETDRLQAEAMAERLRLAVQQTGFPGRADGPPVQKTMSFGVAAFPEDTREGDQLVPLADEALYRAKRSGKNQVQSARRRGAGAQPGRVTRLTRRLR